MKAIISTLVTLLVFNVAQAETQVVKCSGKAASGKTYKVSFKMDDSTATYVTQSGVRHFSHQDIELEEFNSRGKRVFHHIEPVKEFTAIPPAPSTPGHYQYLGPKGESISINSFGKDREIFSVNLGRFRGISIPNANCTVEGDFKPVSVYKINGSDNEAPILIDASLSGEKLSDQ